MSWSLGYELICSHHSVFLGSTLHRLSTPPAGRGEEAKANGTTVALLFNCKSIKLIWF